MPGDRITITDLPNRLPSEDIAQITGGWSETFDQFTHTLTLIGTPARPWDVAVLDDPALARADTTASQLAAAITSTATTLTVATTAGPPWTTSAAHLPLDISVGGEVMRVTAISGTASPQTFTATRSLNGVAKPYSSGVDVRLAAP